MMTCTTCEIMRAKFLARTYIPFAGKSMQEAAELLSAKYGVNYYVSGQQLLRYNRFKPDTPDLIYEKAHSSPV